MVCTQVPETANQLNSCDAFVLTNYNDKKIYIWKGQEASDAENQAAFNNAGVLANTGCEIIELKEGEGGEDF